MIVIMQENRSFDNLFNGFRRADTVKVASDHGTRVGLVPRGLTDNADPLHGHIAFWKAWDYGKMDGFAYDDPHSFSYVPQAQTRPIWELAQRFVLGDRMFQSNTGPSFVAHQYMIAGQSEDADENPVDPDLLSSNKWGCDAGEAASVAVIGPNGTNLPGPYPCFDYLTIADLLDDKGVTWKYYSARPTTGGYIWSAFDAIQHIRFSSDWTSKVITPETQVFTDIEKGALAQVIWITPDWNFSDHGDATATDEGPSWVADIVNAVGASKYWNSTAIFISWDDWGGWYDHVPPPQVDNMGLGFRVPLIVVSPYAKHGYVSHETHEFGSFLRFTEEIFDLPSLGTRDALSDDLRDCFDFNQQPQGYEQIPTKYSETFFINATPSSKPPDDD
ncbi:MAG TPA: alkaline phosphatase family protein [Terracidiphilus sp.]|nr:alkaline phosphatase family protein [Terracidiphilus sp.]